MGLVDSMITSCVCRENAALLFVPSSQNRLRNRSWPLFMLARIRPRKKETRGGLYMEAKVVGPGWDSGGREKQADVWREVGKLGQFYYMGQFCHEIVLHGFCGVSRIRLFCNQCSANLMKG